MRLGDNHNLRPAAWWELGPRDPEPCICRICGDEHTPAYDCRTGTWKDTR